jgi:hypothetical protein
MEKVQKPRNYELFVFFINLLSEFRVQYDGEIMNTEQATVLNISWPMVFSWTPLRNAKNHGAHIYV